MTTPPDGEAITMRIVEVDPGREFTDQVEFDGVVVTTDFPDVVAALIALAESG